MFAVIEKQKKVCYTAIKKKGALHMSMKLSYMTECPESATIYKSACYSAFAMVLLPYLLSWITIDLPTDYSQRVWFDVAYHVLNFAAAAIIFFVFLRDCTG